MNWQTNHIVPTVYILVYTFTQIQLSGVLFSVPCLSLDLELTDKSYSTYSTYHTTVPGVLFSVPCLSLDLGLADRARHGNKRWEKPPFLALTTKTLEVNDPHRQTDRHAHKHTRPRLTQPKKNTLTARNTRLLLDLYLSNPSHIYACTYLDTWIYRRYMKRLDIQSKAVLVVRMISVNIFPHAMQECYTLIICW